MHSIRPQKEGDDEDIDIQLKDFITIFRNDEVSDKVIRMINEEVNYRKKVKQLRQNKVADYDPDCSECNPNDQFTKGSLSISMRSEFNEVIDGSSSEGGQVVVEIPLKQVSTLRIKTKHSKDEPFRPKTYNINNN